MRADPHINGLVTFAGIVTSKPNITQALLHPRDNDLITVWLPCCHDPKDQYGRIVVNNNDTLLSAVCASNARHAV